VTTGQVNGINENLTRVSRDIEAINQDVAVARNDAKTAMSIVGTVDKLALEFPALRAEIREPLALISSANSRYDELEVATKTAVQDIIGLNEAVRQQRDAVDLRLQTNAQAINEVRQLAQQTNINAANEIQKLFLQYQGLKSDVGAQLAIEASPATGVEELIEQQRQTINALQARLNETEERLEDLYQEVTVGVDTRIKRLQARLFGGEPVRKRRRQSPSPDSFALVPSSESGALVPSPTIVEEDIDV
jgi:chromosome segregation ATPase